MHELSLLPILLGEFHRKLRHLGETLIERDARFPQAPSKIKVAIGMRRVGKTYFLYQQILNLLQQGVDLSSILYLNFEDDRLWPIQAATLAHLVDAFYALTPANHDKKCYLFFDEIQNVENWPLVIRRLHDTKNAEIFLTGSSAKLLSKEIATSLRGRSLAIEIWPYSFNEFLRVKKIALDRSLYDQRTQDYLKQYFYSYLNQGGFPEVVDFDTEARQKTLQEYLDVAIYRDIIERHEAKNPKLIKYMLLSIIHNVGKPFAVHKFYNDVKSQGYAVGKDLLYEYSDYIHDAYIAFLVPLYEKSLRRTAHHPKKVYAIDPGLVRAETLDYESDLGRIFENIVYLDLQRLGGKVHYYLTADKYEVDFLVQLPQGQKKLFQVAWEVHNPTTLAREMRALEAAQKELQVEGELITLDTYLQRGISG